MTWTFFQSFAWQAGRKSSFTVISEEREERHLSFNTWNRT